MTLRFRDAFRTVRPVITTLAVIATGAALVGAIYFTLLALQWVAFLSGVLVAAMLAEATRVSRIEWLAMLRRARLDAAKDKLEHETVLRHNAEAALAADKPRLLLMDEAIPTMIAFIDAEGHCQYHNRAFRDWLHLRPEHIQGQHIRKVFGAKVYEETATAIRQALDGNPVHFERMQQMQDGSIYKLHVDHLPQFTADGKVSGFFMLMSDITSPQDLHAPVAERQNAPHEASSVQDSYVDAFSGQVIANTDASQIRKAIENGSFRLYCQLISPLHEEAGEPDHYEILVRLLEEEEGMMPPGAFFPLAEKFGLMPHLDRWVVQHVAQWAAHQPVRADGKASMFFINLAGATLADTGFPEFVRLTLLEYGVPGARLCFEITETELAASSAAAAGFARQSRELGCRIAVSCFGRDRVSFDLLRGIRIDYLKLDGSIVFNILRDPVSLAKLVAIRDVAGKLGVQTIAELVEDEETLAKLRESGIDYAQGFGISHPQPLAE